MNLLLNIQYLLGTMVSYIVHTLFFLMYDRAISSFKIQYFKTKYQMETEMRLKELLFNSNKQIVSSISIKFTQFSSHH